MKKIIALSLLFLLLYAMYRYKKNAKKDAALPSNAAANVTPAGTVHSTGSVQVSSYEIPVILLYSGPQSNGDVSWPDDISGGSVMVE
jgi:hypothetical protein